MKNTTRLVLILFAWLMAGLAVSVFKLVVPGGVAWWIVAGAPAMILLLTLGGIAVVFGISLVASLLSLDRRVKCLRNGHFKVQR